MQRRRWMCIAAGMLCALLLCGCAAVPPADFPLHVSGGEMAAEVPLSLPAEQANVEALEALVQIRLRTCYAVVEATVQQKEIVPYINKPYWRARYLLHVRQFLGGWVPELPATRLLWIETSADQLQVGGRYILTLRKTAQLPQGTFYAGANHALVYWQVLPNGTLRPCPYLQQYPQLQATSLPRTYRQLVQYLQQIERDEFYDSSHYAPYVRGYDVEEAVAFSDSVVWATVTGVVPKTWSSDTTSLEEITVTLHETRMLKGEAVPAQAEYLVRAGRFKEGERYLFLLKGNARYSRFAADELGAIAAEDTQTVRQVYEALGVEMPEE